LAKCPSIFINVNILLEYPREVNPKIVFVGGLTASRPSPLSEDFKRLMDESTGGVVLVSFGTVVFSSRMPPEVKSAFVSTFRHFPEFQITFIWKYEVDDEVAFDLPNVVKRKWVPQRDLLGHRNMRAFVSQCGANGMGEGIYGGVPVVCIPVFFDQMQNARKAEKQKMAVIIQKHNLTSQSLQSALMTVLYDKSYLDSARRISAMVRDSVIPVEEQISSRARITIKMKKVELLDPGSRRLNFLQFFLIDVISIPLILIFFLS
uniref:UDP-glucuronosyltransferase n=1 Tax=Toxocara canis TaxID=6265 RepID=A0A183V5A4_TOXCA